jgi:hypothetical protein
MFNETQLGALRADPALTLVEITEDARGTGGAVSPPAPLSEEPASTPVVSHSEAGEAAVSSTGQEDNAVDLKAAPGDGDAGAASADLAEQEAAEAAGASTETKPAHPAPRAREG